MKIQGHFVIVRNNGATLVKNRLRIKFLFHGFRRKESNSRKYKETVNSVYITGIFPGY